MKLKVLVIDDEKSILQTFKFRLAKFGYHILQATDGETGMEILANTDCDVVITDLKMPGLSGQEIVKILQEKYPDIEIIVITGYATIESAVEAMKAGACDFLSKPLDFEHVRIILEKINDRILLKKENQKLKEHVGELKNELSQKYQLNNMVGKSNAMQNVFRMIERVAPLESTVLIFGETGTGKEMVAKSIHHNSQRKSGPMITVDCGSLTETLLESELFGHEKGAFTGAQTAKRGRFEQAHTGTIFLDEVANASAVVQKKLLRLIQEKNFQRIGGEHSIQVDVRIIAAANQNLYKLVREGTFRRDLFYRLNVVPISIPPLYKRKEDLPLLARHFTDKFTEKMNRKPMTIAAEAIQQLISHFWTGNVRELSNVIERTIIMTSDNLIEKFYLDDEQNLFKQTIDFSSINLDPPLKEQVAALEESYLKKALEEYHGRLNKVEKRAGLNPRTLFRKMKLYGLDRNNFRSQNI